MVHASQMLSKKRKEAQAEAVNRFKEELEMNRRGFLSNEEFKGWIESWVVEER